MRRCNWAERHLGVYRAVTICVFTLLLVRSEAAYHGCKTFYLQGSTPYRGTYELAPSLNRYNDRNTYQHVPANDWYVFYDEAVVRPGWRVANTDLYCNDSAHNLEGITATWEDSTAVRSDIRFKCQEQNCAKIIITHKTEIVGYGGVYTLSGRDPDCHGRPVYRSDHYALYYVSLSPSWRGWVVSRYLCDTRIDDFTIITYSDSYHPGTIGHTWESYIVHGYRNIWKFDEDISVICQSDYPPAPVPVSCEVWRKTAIGLCSGVGIVIILTIAFMMYGVNCYSFTRCCFEDRDYDRSGSDEMNLGQREPLRSRENGRGSTGDTNAPTFMDMANSHRADTDTMTNGRPDYNATSDPDLAPPPEYDGVSINSQASPALVDISTNNFIGFDTGIQLQPAAPPDYDTAIRTSNLQLSTSS